MSLDDNPWQVLSTTQVYNNAWIGVEEHQVLNPNGNPGIYGVVNFKNTAVGVLPLDAECNTWLVGQYRFPLGAYSWEIPEGGCAADEALLDAAARELEEETGLRAGKYTHLLQLHLSNSVSNEVAQLYLAQQLEQHHAAPEDTEVLLVKKLPFEEAYEMVLQGQITDAMSVAAILRVKLLLPSIDKH
ncbi:MAG: NUDIX hydrolase [Bacteroidetes bacterium]|nr:MAG: NUDIX hydrolase [Bacteroidota bacterium]